MSVFSFYEEERANIRRSYLLIFIFIIIMGLFGFLIDAIFDIFPWVTVSFLAIAGIQVLVAVLSGPKMVLSSVGAKPITSTNEEHRQLHNIVEELCVASGLRPPPKIYYIPQEKGINAFATGLKKEDSYVVVTEGLFSNLDRPETQGVIAHELSHIYNRDMLYMTLISAILGAVVIIQTIAFSASRVTVVGGGSRRESSGCSGAFLFFLTVGILATIFSFFGRLLLLAVSRQREYLADAKAVELTRNPYGLANALRKIAKSSPQVKKASLATAHLFISDPLTRSVNEKEGFWANLFSTHPPLYKRVARLEGKSPEQVLKELTQGTS